MRFTQPSPYDVGSIIPELAKRSKTTVRLNPRGISRMPIAASKVGGTIPWPKNEPWPVCGEHSENLVPVLQLRKDDIPELPFPKGTDLFQLLWCPHSLHETPEYAPPSEYGPFVRIFWRSLLHCTPPLRAIPEPHTPDEELVPKLCRMHPERVIEYPSRYELDDRLQKRLNDLIPDGESLYFNLLSAAPGYKVGGYVHWSGGDPRTPVCANCRKQMEHLVTIASREYDCVSYQRWAPRNEHHLANAVGVKQLRELDRKNKATGICIGDLGSICVFACIRCDPALSRSLRGNL